MKYIIFLAFLVLASPALADIWTSCGTASDEFAIKSVIIKPDPPVKGQNVSIEVIGSLAVTVTTGAQVTLKLKYGLITVFDHAEPLCGAPINIKCPVSAGAFDKTIAPGPLPNDAPSGTYAANAVFSDQNGKELACVNVNLKL